MCEPLDPEIEARIAEIAHEANRSNDNDWWPEAEEIARNAIRTALYDRELIEKIKMPEGHKATF